MFYFHNLQSSPIPRRLVLSFTKAGRDRRLQHRSKVLAPFYDEEVAMPRPWNEIAIDELLNYEAPNTATIARYDRIMRHHTNGALGQVWAGLHDVKAALQSESERIAERMRAAEDAAAKAAAAQMKLQRAAFWLTLVLVGATVAYTCITYDLVKAQREATSVQRELLTAKAAKSEADQ